MLGKGNEANDGCINKFIDNEANMVSCAEKRRVYTEQLSLLHYIAV